MSGKLLPGRWSMYRFTSEPSANEVMDDPRVVEAVSKGPVSREFLREITADLREKRKNA